MKVELVDVDETVLSKLVEAATQDAHPNEVTPPLSADEEWTDERVEWLRSFHRDRRGGLSPFAIEASWAVRAEGTIVGGARLRRADRSGSVEAGAWLCRSARGHGIGRGVLTALVDLAARAGAGQICAETSAGNHAAIAVLQQLGFQVTEVCAASNELPGRPRGAILRLCRQLPPMPAGTPSAALPRWPGIH